MSAAQIGWRVIADGAMVDKVSFTAEDGKEVTTTGILRAGTLIKGPISKSMVDRYDDNEEFVRSIVERVEYHTEVDEETNEERMVITPIGKPASAKVGDTASAAEARKALAAKEKAEADKAEAIEKAQASEKKAEDLQAQIDDLMAQLAARPEPAAEESSDSPEALTVEQIDAMNYAQKQAAAKERKLDVAGNAKDEDLTAALKATIA